MTDKPWVKKPSTKKAAAAKQEGAEKATAPRKTRAKRTTKSSKAFPENCVFRNCEPETRKFKGLCRMCYLSNWKDLKANENAKAKRRLNAYVERLAKKYPEDFLEKIKDGIQSEDVFNQMVSELEIDGDVSAETEREFLEKLSRKVGDEE